MYYKESSPSGEEWTSEGCLAGGTGARPPFRGERAPAREENSSGACNPSVPAPAGRPAPGQPCIGSRRRGCTADNQGSWFLRLSKDRNRVWADDAATPEHTFSL